jgi:hypothetical protein
MRERPDRERKKMTKTLRGKAALDAWDKMAVWITPARRARVANAVTAALDGCASNPKALTWPDKYIELLGHSATRTDQRAVTRLEQFRAMAAETRRSESGTPFARVWSRPTGLLDLKGLEEAIERIRLRGA